MLVFSSFFSHFLSFSSYVFIFILMVFSSFYFIFPNFIPFVTFRVFIIFHHVNHLLDFCLLSVGCLGFALFVFWFLGFLASWLFGSLAFWLFGFLASWLFGFVASWLSGLFDFRLCGFSFSVASLSTSSSCC